MELIIYDKRKVGNNKGFRAITVFRKDGNFYFSSALLNSMSIKVGCKIIFSQDKTDKKKWFFGIVGKEYDAAFTGRSVRGGIGFRSSSLSKIMFNCFGEKDSKLRFLVSEKPVVEHQNIRFYQLIPV